MVCAAMTGPMRDLSQYAIGCGVALRASPHLYTQTDTEHFDAVVAGGGIVGTACASELVRAGLRVALIEPSVIGGGATAAGMGHLAVMDDSEAQFALTRYSQLLWKELALRLSPDAEYFPCGALWVAADDREMAEVERKQGFYQALSKQPSRTFAKASRAACSFPMTRWFILPARRASSPKKQLPQACN